MLSALQAFDSPTLAAIEGLAARVLAVDGGRLKLELGWLTRQPAEGSRAFVWQIDDAGPLVGFCGIYGFGARAELAGMVDPAHRRRGIGRALLDAAAGELHSRGTTTALLITPRDTPAGGAFALAAGGKLEHSEHFMVLDGTPPPPKTHDDVTLRPGAAADLGPLRRILGDAFGHPHDDFTMEDGPTESQLVIERSGEVVGALRISGGTQVSGIYGFAIDPAWQGRGIGRDVLSRVTRQLRAAGVERVTLEVDVANDSALGLYTSVGFRRETTEDYYALALD
jgi:ribosomal protein S18 acetylase RimI-like enzyme